jgi:outer membrane lipoprotein carrier protein
MRYFFLLSVLASLGFSNITDIKTFEADFIQKITDEKNKTLTYNGHLKASKPAYALWEYKNPIQKNIYIEFDKITIIEPELEQAIIKYINEDFDFFSMIRNSKKIDDNMYVATFKQTNFYIETDTKKIKSISYKDELDNNVIIIFNSVIQNKEISKSIFTPNIPQGYDILNNY